MESTGLTKREFQIMNVLWNSSEPLSAHDVSVAAPELSRNTIQIVLKNFRKSVLWKSQASLTIKTL